MVSSWFGRAAFISALLLFPRQASPELLAEWSRILEHPETPALAKVLSVQPERPDVGGDVPAISGGNLRSIIRHGAKPIRHHVEEVSQRRLAQSFRVIRRRPPVTALHDHSVSIPQLRMTRRAVNIEAFAASG
jgi:hypothetical protein